MKLVVRTGSADHEVTIRRSGESYEVAIGERFYRVDAVSVGPHRRSLLLEGDQHEVSVRFRDAETALVTSRHGSVQVEVADPLTHLARISHGGGGKQGKKLVTALMPGRVVALLKAEGDAVAVGDGIVVLEAMKMENELKSERDGTLQKLHVQVGQAVETGDPLFEVG